MARLFLAAVGLLYAYLAVWCSLQPAQTSSLVGFDLRPGSGQSEFLVVYGGLELGLALVFLWPLWRPQQVQSSLLACLLIHGCLVVFRSVSFGLYSDIQAMTYKLAAGEWLIFLVAAWLTWRTSRPSPANPVTHADRSRTD
jgi:hypothetical protein